MKACERQHKVPKHAYATGCRMMVLVTYDLLPVVLASDRTPDDWAGWMLDDVDAGFNCDRPGIWVSTFDNVTPQGLAQQGFVHLRENPTVRRRPTALKLELLANGTNPFAQ